MSAIDTLSQEIMTRLNRPLDNTFIPLIVRRLVQTEEEAKLILELSMPPEEIASILGTSKEEVNSDLRSYDKPLQIEAVAKKLNIPKKKVKDIIQQKFELGVVFPTRRGWQLLRSWLQFRESTLGMEPKHDQYVGKEYFELMQAWNDLEEYPRFVQRYLKFKAENKLPGSRCLPDWQAIKDNPDRIPDEYLPDILERASRLEGMSNLAFVNCPCARMVRGLDYKKDEIKVCLQMGRSADYAIRRGTGKKVTVDEALQVFKEQEDRGTAHLSVGNVKTIPGGIFWMICNCFKGSCDVIDPYTQAGIAVASAISPSRYRAFVELDKCQGCQTCVERCMFGAAQMKLYPGESRWKAWIDPDLCMGCGSCTLTCPAGARTLKVVRPTDFIPDEIAPWETP